MSMVGSPSDAIELHLAGVVRGLAIGAGMELDHWDSERMRGLELMWLGLDEHGNAYSSTAQFINKSAQSFVAASHVEPTFGGSFDAAFGHDAGGMR